jgi:hypothetical protein
MMLKCGVERLSGVNLLLARTFHNDIRHPRLICVYVQPNTYVGLGSGNDAILLCTV